MDEIWFARDVVAGGTLREAASDDDIFDLGGIDAGALDRMTQHVRRDRDAVGLVERASRGARGAGPTVGDDGDVFHAPALRCRATLSSSEYVGMVCITDVPGTFGRYGRNDLAYVGSSAACLPITT